MRKAKECESCELPFKEEKVRVLVLNGSLKHAPESSNTEELAEAVISHMKEWASVEAEFVRLADKKIDVGLGFKESETDEWPEVAEKVREADVILFATPIWWGERSSLMQRVIERFDAFDEEYLETRESAIYNKVAGIVITGHEDGALATQGALMKALTWLGFLLPPECACYWVGEVGEESRGSDAEKRRKNKATSSMAKRLARNLVYFSQLLTRYPIVFEKK